jgi:hypothetical protein
MLPCNVMVFEKGDRNVLSVIKPTVAMEMVDTEGLRPRALFIDAVMERQGGLMRSLRLFAATPLMLFSAACCPGITARRAESGI